MIQSIKTGVLLLFILSLAACNASDSVSHYEKNDSANGPRIDKEHLEAAPLPPDTLTGADTARDSLSRRSISPPGATDTTKLNMQK